MFTKKAFADTSNVRQINPCFRQRHLGFDTRIQFGVENFSFWQTDPFFAQQSSSLQNTQFLEEQAQLGELPRRRVQGRSNWTFLLHNWTLWSQFDNFGTIFFGPIPFTLLHARLPPVSGASSHLFRRANKVEFPLGFFCKSLIFLTNIKFVKNPS